jgi:hypothetical protein
VFLNHGEDCSTFTLVDYPISPLARDIALCDLNGDESIDIATSHVSSVDRVSVMVNLGAGTFAPAVEFFPGIYPQSLTIADFDADGRNDIATANQFHDPRTVGVLINVTPSTVPGDVTGDGVLDEEDRAAFCSALGSSSGEPAFIAAADLNSDGTIDHLDQQLFNDVLPPCDGDVVSSATFQPPADGVTDAADLAFLLGAWGSQPSCADFVTSKTFALPPDGQVDGADLAYLLGAWGACE